jgi:glycosyltransferase involved in cell wall biosynthesis
MPPLVSVIIPTYERSTLLRQTVESALAQTFDGIEVIVVEDGSAAAATALRGCDGRVRYHRQEHRGVSRARNTGVRLASGEWLAFLDDDDLWDPRKLERQLALASQKPASIRDSRSPPTTTSAPGRLAEPHRIPR